MELRGSWSSSPIKGERPGDDGTDVTATLRSVVGEQFPQLDVTDLRIEDRTGSDGDPLYWVTVIFRGGRPEVDGRLGLIRRARDRLAEVGDDHLPVFSFMTEADVKAISAATR